MKINYKTIVINVPTKNSELETMINEKLCKCLGEGWEIVSHFVVPACANPNKAEKDVEFGFENINNLYNRIVFILYKADYRHE